MRSGGKGVPSSRYGLACALTTRGGVKSLHITGHGVGLVAIVIQSDGVFFNRFNGRARGWVDEPTAFGAVFIGSGGEVNRTCTTTRRVRYRSDGGHSVHRDVHLLAVAFAAAVGVVARDIQGGAFVECAVVRVGSCDGFATCCHVVPTANGAVLTESGRQRVVAGTTETLVGNGRHIRCRVDRYL